MPVAPRPKGKARDIAWNILGKPANLQVKRTKKEKKIRRQLIVQETVYSR